MSTIEEVSSRIAKLLKLAERAGSPEEAATAAAKASALMEEFQLTRDMLDESDVKTPEEPIIAASERDGAIDTGSQYRSEWRRRLIIGLARHHQCKLILGYKYVPGDATCVGRMHHTFDLVGRGSDVQTVKYLYTYIVGEIDRLTDTRAKGQGKGFANSFRLGAVSTILDTLYQSKTDLVDRMKREAEASVHSDRALIRIQTALEREEKHKDDVEEWANGHFKLVASKPMRSSARDYSGYDAGRQAGRSVAITGARGSLGSGKKALGGGST